VRLVGRITVLVAAICACAAPVVWGGEVFLDTFKSPALNREVKFTIYLPDGYKDSADRYPVIYLLHGAGGDENEWRTKGGATETIDGLIRRGQLRPSVVVMPSFGPASFWANGAAERAETAFIDELLPHVESRYKVAIERSSRSIGGLSMGGYGSLNLALRYPDKFCAAAIISPGVYDPLPPETSAARRTPQFMRNNQFDPETWKSLNYPAHLETYTKALKKVPMWIVSGDHDRFGIALMSAQLYWRLFQIQPKQVELRIVDGDHEWLVFRDALSDALQYVDHQCMRVR
jgi:enterochelin esterase-like enzyme